MSDLEAKLDEILEAYRRDCQRGYKPVEEGMHLSKDQTKAAIHEIGLKITGTTEIRQYPPPNSTQHHDVKIRNELRAKQHKGWAKACGMAE